LAAVSINIPRTGMADSGGMPSTGRLLLVGAQAVACGPLILAQRQWEIASAQSVLEAVLISGQAVGLILVDAGPEIDHLQAGIRSLRQVNPGAHIVLLCQPVDECVCRRALAWGADDYEIVPLEAACAARLACRTVGNPTLHPAQHPLDPLSPPAALRLTPRAPSASAPSDDLPSMPLMMQTELLEEILEGGGVRPDFAQRATALLVRRLDIGGILKFRTADTAAPADAAAAPGREFRRAVTFAGQAPFGTLVWLAENPDPGAAEAGVLAQAAHWLGTMLALAQRYEQLRLMAITDELSGAYNRRYFMKYMDTLLERSRENRSRVTLLLFDIDDFKRYNDTFGHGSGDAIIRELIKLLRACTRPKDLVARIGGDEFAVVYWDNEPPRQPNSDHPKEIIAATERFREAIKNHQWPETCRIKGTISISGGLASFPWDADTLEALMQKADEALLQAKKAGKNVIILHSKATGEARAVGI